MYDDVSSFSILTLCFLAALSPVVESSPGAGTSVVTLSAPTVGSGTAGAGAAVSSSRLGTAVALLASLAGDAIVVAIVVVAKRCRRTMVGVKLVDLSERRKEALNGWTFEVNIKQDA